MNARTNGPWEYCESVNGEDPCYFRVDGAPSDGMCNIVTWCDKEEDAAFIVRACNSHDALVAALRKAKPIVGAAVAASPNESRPLREKVYEQIVAALAAAEGA